MSGPTHTSPEETEALRRLRGTSGRTFWRSLDELLEVDSFRAKLAAEFPALAKGPDDWRRRDLLKCLGGALALAGLDGCERQADEEALPYVVQPPGVMPGVPNSYATAVLMDGIAQPVLGQTREGRPIKLEGNPDHPASRGATDAFTQAALLGLYDPERSSGPLEQGVPTDWTAATAALEAAALRADRNGGAGLRLLIGPSTSPTLAGQLRTFTQRWPAARWHSLPLGESVGESSSLDTERRLDLAAAHVVVSIGADPLGPGPRQTLHAGRWAERRIAFQNGRGEALLMVAEASPTLTGMTARERLVAAEKRHPALLAALGFTLGIGGAPPRLTSREQAWITAAAAALRRNPGRGLLLLGGSRAGVMTPLAAAIEQRLGNAGVASRPAAPLQLIPPEGQSSLAELIAAMRGSNVETLLMLGANPVYSLPPALGFADALRHVTVSIHAGLHVDETARRSRWHLPLAHELERWDDALAANGSAVIIQPLVRPWLDVRAGHAVLGLLLGDGASDRERVQATWVERWGVGNLEQRWMAALQRGLAAESDSAPAASTPAPSSVSRAPAPDPAGGDELDLLIRPDPCLWDGAFSPNPWMQECPKPFTKLTWGNAVHVSPALARERDLENGRLVRLSRGGASVVGPVWVLPGQERSTILIHLGSGRQMESRVAKDVGFAAAPLVGRTGPVSLERLEGTVELASTQRHFTMAGHDFVRFVESATAKLPPEPPPLNFYKALPATNPSWGMAIDLDLCIACNACVVACVAENNIPMVGREQVAKGREMHWIRVDHYHEGSADDPRHMPQPVPCMHCENAPCEMGCPVNATVHSPDGLNLQVYNRCIGTRTCSSYCPYKVRRFNWFDLTGDDPPSVRAARNPDVTVRSRGVMEKCTYCIQRIERERIQAKVEDRAMGPVQTACQQACPTQAISFGNIADSSAEVSRRKAGGRDYPLLREANTRPRTTYQARIEEREG